MAIRKPSLKWRLKHYTSRRFISGWISNKIAKYIPRLTKGNVTTMSGKLGARVRPAKYLFKGGPIVDYGTLSYQKVTNDFAAFLVTTMQAEDTSVASFFYHAAGTDNTAESSGDTELGSEILRSTGTLTETSAQVFKSVATLTFASSNSVLEHGLLNDDTSGPGILMDRSIYTAIELNSSDQIEYTYELTVESGG